MPYKEGYTHIRGGQPVALSHQNATEPSNCATGGIEKIGEMEKVEQFLQLLKFPSHFSRILSHPICSSLSLFLSCHLHIQHRRGAYFRVVSVFTHLKQ